MQTIDYSALAYGLRNEMCLGLSTYLDGKIQEHKIPIAARDHIFIDHCHANRRQAVAKYGCPRVVCKLGQRCGWFHLMADLSGQGRREGPVHPRLAIETFQFMSAFWYGNAEVVVIFLRHFKTRVLSCEAGSCEKVIYGMEPGDTVPTKPMDHGESVELMMKLHCKNASLTCRS